MTAKQTDLHVVFPQEPGSFQWCHLGFDHYDAAHRLLHIVEHISRLEVCRDFEKRVLAAHVCLYLLLLEQTTRSFSLDSDLFRISYFVSALRFMRHRIRLADGEIPSGAVAFGSLDFHLGLLSCLSVRACCIRLSSYRYRERSSHLLHLFGVCGRLGLV